MAYSNTLQYALYYEQMAEQDEERYCMFHLNSFFLFKDLYSTADFTLFYHDYFFVSLWLKQDGVKWWIQVL